MRLLVAGVALVAFHWLQKVFSSFGAEAAPCSKALVQAQHWSIPVDVLQSPLLPAMFAEAAVEWIGNSCGLLSFNANSSTLEKYLSGTIDVFQKRLPQGSRYIAVVSKARALFSRALCLNLRQWPVEVTTPEDIGKALHGVDRIAIFGDYFEDLSEGILKTIEQIRRLNLQVDIVSPMTQLSRAVIDSQYKKLWAAPYQKGIEKLFTQISMPNEVQNENILEHIMKTWLSVVLWEQRVNPLHATLQKLADREKKGTYVISDLAPSSVKPQTTFFLPAHYPKLVVKLLQGDCVIAGNDFSKTPYSLGIALAPRQYPHIPSYQTIFRRAAVSAIAHLVKIAFVPRATLAVIQNARMRKQICAVEEYVDGAFVERTLAAYALRSDFEIFSQYLLFSFLIGNSDMHDQNQFIFETKDNFLPILIDFDGTFPTKNGDFMPCLKYDNAPSFCFKEHWDLKRPLTPWIRDFVQTFPLKRSNQILKDYDLEETIPAFEKRFSGLQNWLQIPNITLHDLCEKMTFYGR